MAPDVSGVHNTYRGFEESMELSGQARSHDVRRSVSPQFCVFYSSVINGEVVSDHFQFVNARPIGGISGLVNHENSVSSSLASVGSQESNGGSRGNLSSVIENNFD